MKLPNIQSEVKEWAIKNFGETESFENVKNCSLGVIEELGECHHVLLKHRQGIRGFGEVPKAQAAFVDGLCDSLIYLFDLSNRAEDCGLILQIPIEFEPADKLIVGRSMIENIKRLINIASGGNFLREDCFAPLVLEMFSVYSALAVDWNVDLGERLQYTWNGVRLRDWRKYPGSGYPEGTKTDPATNLPIFST